MADHADDAAHVPGEDQGASAHAEELLEDWGRRVGRFLSSATARVREEAEDIFAEARSIKRGERE